MTPEAQLVELRQLSGSRKAGFGTSGVRALVSALDPVLCYAYSRAFMDATGVAESVVLCHDLRPSSPAIASYCARAFLDQGVRVRFGGAAPTPAAAYAAMQLGCPAIIVTGSHIPFDRNGIKFYRSSGEITKADEEAILGSVIRVPAGFRPAPLPEIDTGILAAYRERYLRFFPPFMLRGLRLGVYQHSGVARDLLVSLLEALGAEVVAFGRTEDFVAIDTEALSPADRENARGWVKEYGLAAILSTDGDADRPLIADEQGEWFRGDLLGVLCARYLGMKTVVTPINSNTVVERTGWFGRVVRTRIGSPYVLAGIAEAIGSGADGVCGYEANGGFLLATPVEGRDGGLSALPTRDALLPMLSALAMASMYRRPLSGLRALLPERHTHSDRLSDLAEGAAQKLVLALADDRSRSLEIMAPGMGAVARSDVVDGLRLEMATDDVVHLRASGNAPELRCYAESDSHAKAVDLVEGCLRKARGLLR